MSGGVFTAEQLEVIEAARSQRAAEWRDPRHRDCCWRCGWHVSSHGVSPYTFPALDCPGGVSPAARARHLPPRSGTPPFAAVGAP